MSAAGKSKKGFLIQRFAHAGGALDRRRESWSMGRDRELIMDAEGKAGRVMAEAVTGPQRNTLLGMACMAGAALLFMAGNAVIKHLAYLGIPPIETVFFRGAVSLVLLAPFALRTRGVLKTAHLGQHVLRAVIQAASMACFFYGIVHITLVEANALEFTSPIIATVLAMAFFGEPVRWRRITAMIVALVGALIALRPGFQDLNQGHGLIAFSCFLWAIVLLYIRGLSQTDSALTQSLYLGLIMTPLAGIGAAFVWVTPNAEQLAFLCTVGLTATAGQYLFQQAFRYAEMSAVLPLDFTKLIWSALIGYFAFSVVPDALTILGASIIFAAGAYITLREARLLRQGRPL